MDFDLYKRIIDSCPSVGVVHPQGLGEPLLYPHFIEALAYAKRRGKKVLFYTNAALLDNDMSERVLDVLDGVDRIRFSVDGYNKDTYEATRPGLPWKTVLANIENFQRLKDRGGYSLKTLVRMTETEENESVMKDMVGFWRERVDKVSVVREIYVPTPTELAGRNTASGDVQSSLHLSTLSDGTKVFCEKPFRHLTVLSDGTLVFCCRDGYGSYAMADLNEEPDILKAFNNEQFQKSRAAMREGIDYPIICDTCYQPVKRGTELER